MPKLNKNLVRSIVQDLTNLEKSCDELHRLVKNVEFVSWRYPTQKCHSIQVNSILCKFKGSAYECYLLILELMYDRFQYFLNLLIKYLDMIPLVSAELNLPQNVISSGFLSTGSLLSMFWTRIKLLHHHIIQTLEKATRHSDQNYELNATLSLGALLSQNLSSSTSHQLHLMSRSTQTGQCSLTKCENCCISEDVLKFVMNEIKTKCTENQIDALLSDNSFMTNMKKESLDITQWGAMMKWTETIKSDLKLMLNIIIQQMEVNSKLKISLLQEEKDINEELLQKNEEVHALENNILSLQQQLEAEKQQIKSLEQNKEKQNKQIIKLTESIQELELKLKTSETMQNKRGEYVEKLESEIKKIASRIDLNVSNFDGYTKIKDELKKFIASNESEKLELKHKLKEARSDLQAKEKIYEAEIEKRDIIIKYEKERQSETTSRLKTLKDYILESQDLRKENEKLQSKLSDSEQKINSLKSISENLEEELQQKKLREKLLLEYPDTNTRIEVEVHGNPEQDMENQIKANQIRIKLLTEQITKLEGTLNKLRKLTKGQA